MQLGIDSQIPDGLLAANALLAENSRLGVPTSTHTLHRGFQFAISSTYKGLEFRCYESASDPVVVSNYLTGGTDIAYYRFFMTHYCGPGGAGDPTGVIDRACKAHDECYAAAGIDASANTSSSISLTLQQASAAQACNQALYNAARSNPQALGSNAIRLWLTKGDQTPFRGHILAPGTEAKQW